MKIVWQGAKGTDFVRKTAILALLTVALLLTLILSHLLCSVASGDSWAPQSSGTSSSLYGVWGASSSNVFACGDNGTVMHFEGSQWNRLPTGVGNVLYGIWGDSTEVFVTGNAGSIIHYDGVAWNQMISGTKNHLNAIWGTATDSVFAAGSKGTILRYDGVSWSGMSTNVSNTLYGLWGSSSGDVFAVGNGGVILRLQEDTWSQMSSNTIMNLWGIWGSSSSNVFAVGNNGCILHYDGIDWTQMTNGTVDNLYCIWGASSDEVFAAGANGTILRFDGNTWTPMSTVTNSSLRGMWGSSPTDVFAVGDSGTILHYAELIPILTSVSPNQGNQGDDSTITITGNNFADTSGISFGEGIYVEDFCIDSPTQITANVTIASDAVTGSREVVVTNSHGTGRLNGGFVIPQSHVDSVFPSTAIQGQSAQIVISGSNLGGATAVSLGTGIGVTSFNVQGPTKISANITVDGSAAPGPRDVSVTTPGSTASLIAAFTVNSANEPPAAADDAYVAAEDQPLVVPAPGVLGNDTDVDGNTLTAVLVTGSSHGVLDLNSDGSFSYTPNLDFYGGDSFTYQAYDGLTNSGNATVNITINPVNDAPFAVPDTYSTEEDMMLNVAAPGVLANDSDPEGGVLTAALYSGPSHGTLSLSSDGAFSYSPESNFYGSDSFAYRAYDGELYSGTVTVQLTVSPVNDAPVARDNAYVATAGHTLQILPHGVLENDDDIDGDELTAVLAQDVGHGTLTLNPDGSFSYTPDNDFSGTDAFSYRAFDDSLYSQVATVTLTVNWLNSPPSAADDAYSVDEDEILAPAKPGILGNDSDPDGNLLTAILVVGPVHGTLALNPNGSFTYTPNADYHGSDFFTYLASDGVATSEPAMVSISVDPVNDGPRAASDTVAATEDQILIVNAPGILANDSDRDGDSLTAVLIRPADHGTIELSGDGSFNYIPGVNFVGMDSFSYQASDGSLDSDTVEVFIQVNRAPPVVLSVSPSVGLPGEAIQITISGANLSAVSDIGLGAGISIVSYQTESDELIAAEILIETDAASGKRDITVVTSAGVTKLAGAFQINTPQPIISAITPTSAFRGQHLEVSLSGDSFQDVTSISFGEAIAVESYRLISSQEISVSISVAPEALPGPRDVTVSTLGGTASLPDEFEVIRSAPVVTSLSSPSGQRGRSFELVINGENLDQATAINLGDGIIIETFYLDGSNRVVATVRIADDASTGPRDVSVTTPQGTATLPEGFTVEWTLDPSSIWLWLGVGLIATMLSLFLVVTRRRQTKKWSLLDLSHRR